MSRPPSIPSHGGPPVSYQPYSRPSGTFSQTEGDHRRSREPSEGQSITQRLPSLRTLLEPELLDKPSDYPLQQMAPQHRSNASPQYASSSPTLKRRLDFESHGQDHFERSVPVLQMSYVHRPPPPPPPPPPSHVQMDQQSATPSTPGSALSNGSMEHHHPGSNQSLHDYNPINPFHQPSTASDSMAALLNRPSYDEAEDPTRPVRRRIDALSRAPVRSSRCIAQREMPGEGLCYIYEDGTYCRAIIDGEPVNPSWGITKAGKPRKRLAQACLTCREKKIKCEPGYPKCHQCAKAQRVCRG